MKTPYKKLTAEQKKTLYENVRRHRSIVQSWLFRTSDITDDDAMESLHWLSMFCWYSTK